MRLMALLFDPCRHAPHLCQIVQAGSKDGSSSTVPLYVNSHIVCGLFCSWQDAPPQSFERSIWDHVGFYTIHTFLNPLVECPVKSFLKLIISFLVLHIVLLSLIKLLILVALTRHAALNLPCLLEVGQQAQCTILKFVYTRTTPSSRHNPQASGTGLSCKPSMSISLAESLLVLLRARNAVDCFPTICSTR